MSYDENAIINPVVSFFAGKPTPSYDAIKEKVEGMAALFGYTGDLQKIIRRIETATNCTMDVGIYITSNEDAHDVNWIKRIQASERLYANKYENYLKEEGMPPVIVDTISKSNDEVLSLLDDPYKSESFQRRGLVIGDVQSGKTSNYLSLITKAADAGYKFIIVIAGIHNNLRKQTQQRIDYGFIGRESLDLNKRDKRAKVGVGLEHGRYPDEDYPHPISLTTQDEDFNGKFASQFQTEIGDFNKPVILVIKKNRYTLRNLERWLITYNTTHKVGSKIDAPMLMIDDESDNASINTNKIEDDPTITNDYLRKILNLFSKSCYVGYTATPFANIFIDPESYSDSYEDLFPKDFIYCLNPPSNYFGPQKIFLDDDYERVRVPLYKDEVEAVFPNKHKKTLHVTHLPESMKNAVYTFVLTKAVRNLRDQEKSHCSMLINVSTFVDVQNQIANHVSSFLKNIGNNIVLNGSMGSSFYDETIHKFKKIYLHRFVNNSLSEEEYPEWEDVLAELVRIFDDSPKDYDRDVFVVNSKTQKPLDYSEYSRQKRGLMAIVIGGFSLSRGLTIEGLTVSYFYRNTQMYDTLLQMGRWFGYRPDYEDLCRIYMTDQAFAWYQHITKAVEDLRNQVARMHQVRATPKDFGLYVQSSDDGLLVTARNKSRRGQKFEVSKSFSGELKELYLLTKDIETQEYNYGLFRELWNNLKNASGSNITVKSADVFKDVSTQTILNFLYGFRPGFKLETVSFGFNNAINYLEKIKSKYPTMDVSFITKGLTGSLESFDNIKPVERTVFEDENSYKLNKARIGSQQDEKHGLSEDDLAYEDRLIEDECTGTGKDKVNKAVIYRKLRNKPLLLLYVIDPMLRVEIDENEYVKKKPDCYSKGIPTVALSFPFGDDSSRVTILANTVYDQNQISESDIESFEGEDYDF